MGVVSSPLHPALASAIGRWIAPGGRARTNGLVNGSALVGIAVALLVFGMLIRVLDWPRAFFVGPPRRPRESPPPGRGSSPRRPPEHRPQVAKAPGESRIRDLLGGPELWTNRSLILLTLSYAAVSYFQYLFFYWMTHYFKTVLKLPESQSQTYAAIPPLAMGKLRHAPGARLVERSAERRLGPRRAWRIVPMAGMTAGGVFLILGIFRDRAWNHRDMGWAAAAARRGGDGRGAVLGHRHRETRGTSGRDTPAAFFNMGATPAGW